MTDVVERVMQLVRLAVDKGATSEEGRSAAAKACELIAKHDLRVVDGRPGQNRVRVGVTPHPGVRHVDVMVDLADILAGMATAAAAGSRPRPSRPPPPPPPPVEPSEGWAWCKPLPRTGPCSECGCHVMTYDGGFVCLAQPTAVLHRGCAMRRWRVR
jgi:hypothetical protein